MQQQIVLNIGPALMPDLAIGAFFYAILAWPTADVGPKFSRVSEELMAGIVGLTNAENPDLMRATMADWPQFDWQSLELRARKRKPAVSYLQKRLDQRMAAARIGIGMAHEEIFGIPALLPPGIIALSIDQLCALVKSDVWIDDPDNIEKLVWRKSLPIIHLAMATQLLLAAKFPESSKIGRDLQHIIFFREAVRLAELLEPLVHEHPDIAITRDRMTLIRWFA